LSAKLPYIRPVVHKQVIGIIPDSQYKTVVNLDRRYVDVSDGFCDLVGYKREELIGKQYDDLTAPKTNDIPTVFKLFTKSGYMHGLWMLVNRQGENILVRYESWIRADSLIEGRMEAVDSQAAVKAARA
jgi:PAS domain S-box-containing protein